MTRILTEFQEAFLQENIWGKTNQELADLMNQQFELCLSRLQVKNYKRNHKLGISGLTGYFPKNHIPENKGKKFPGKINSGCFSKGDMPINIDPVGTEKLKDDGYIWRKVTDPNIWKQVHRIIWEEANGEIPEGHKLIFADGNRKNVSLENLLLVTDHQLLIMNKKNLIKEEKKLTEVGVNIAKLYEKISERKKEIIQPR
mgnify:CR=1 FL=1